ncbi:MAG: TVP38/TMEM64 family protein [Candidatus Omnitrophica bacterium]|nr:TVP38/TMEM64 family protein [Candidatus Omnitrophota bacterium]
MDAQSLFIRILERIKELGIIGGLLFAVIYIAACILFLPGSVLTLGAGFVYKLFWGTVLVSATSTAGAAAAFLIGRYFARSWVSKKIDSYPKFRAIDKAVAAEGWKIVGLTRLSPVFPFNFLNYAYGLTSVPFKQYVLASWIGMLPGTVMYVYLGSLAGSLATLGTGSGEGSTARLMLSVVGLAATVAVTVFITRLARKALSEHVGSENGKV